MYVRPLYCMLLLVVAPVLEEEKKKKNLKRMSPVKGNDLCLLCPRLLLIELCSQT